MIHHLSIAARDPKHVAGVLAEFMGGVAVPFPPNPGSFFALQLDEHGSGVEVHPAGTELQPGGNNGGSCSRDVAPPSGVISRHRCSEVCCCISELLGDAGIKGPPRSEGR